MSLILEALRKSEAERQAASLPGLIAPAAQAAPPRRRGPGWLWGLPLVLLLGLGLGWWVPRWLAAPPAPSPAQHTADQPSPAEQTAPTASQPAARASNERAAALAETAHPVEPARSAPTPTPTPTPVTDRPATPVKLSPLPAPLPAAPRPASPAVESQPSAVEPGVAKWVSLAMMPSAQRAQLPALKLSVHVFAPEADRRFAIVDGRRVVEGDGLGQGVTLREIRRDGLLLDIAGNDWLLERGR